MTRMMARWLALLICGLAPATGVAAAPVHRIVAVGDLHGDFAVWRAIARAAGIVDAGGRWSGGGTVLVQDGDVIDRGPDGKRLIEELMRLQREAAKAGGRVVAMIGNHEAMNMTGDLRYVSAADYAAYADAGSAGRRAAFLDAHRPAIVAAYRKADPTLDDAGAEKAWLAATPLGALEHQAAWAPAGRIGRWVIDNPAVAVIDDTLFVHGGISAAYAGQSVEAINAAVAAALRAGETAPTSIINDDKGPLWYRGLAATGPAVEPELDAGLAAFHVRRMVIAHTPVLSGIAILYGGKLARIDTGDAAVFGGTPSYLEIIDGTLVPHAVPRPAAKTEGG